MNLLEIIISYLEERGWRFEAPEGAIDQDPLTGAWWTRDEFKEWWVNPRTSEKSDRFIELSRAIREQVELEDGKEPMWVGHGWDTSL